MGLYWIPPGNRFMCSRRSRMCGIMRGAIDWKYSARSPLVMPSAGKRTLSGWVMVIACPSKTGIVGSFAFLPPPLWGRVGVGGNLGLHGDAGALEDGGDEIVLGERADERSPPIDHRVRDATDTELVREVRELVRLDADGLDLGRGQCHPVSQAHGPGTVGSSRRRKDHDLGRLGQLGQRRHAFLTQAMFLPRDALDGVDQGGELSAGGEALE